MRVEFVGQSSRDGLNKAANPSRLINGYREPLVPGGRAGYVLRSVPGMMNFATIPNIFMRALMVFKGNILAVCGMSLYNITPPGVATLIGSVGAVDDITGIDQNTGMATIVAGGVYYTWDGTTLATVATGQVTVADSVAYLGGYTLVTQRNGRVFSWSGLALPGTWPGSSFASAEITDDPIIRGFAFKDAYYIFKKSGFERWATTGLAGDLAFQRIDGAQIEPGLKSYGLITSFPNGFAFVGNDGRIHAWVNGGISPISTPPIEVALTEYGPLRMFFYERRGHGFICLVFGATLAWCYDVATGEWHERSQNDGPWLARASVKLSDDWYIGTDSGAVAKLSPECADFGEPLVRRYVSRTMEDEDRFNVAMIEVFPRIDGDIQGDGDGSEAKIAIRTSRDGITWGAEKPRGVGAVGAYQTRLVWRALGQFRRATVEVSASSLTDIPILAEMNVVTA